MPNPYFDLQSQAIGYLHARVESFLLIRDSFADRIRIECSKKNQPYKGLRSWPTDLRLRIKQRQKDLIAYMKKMGLCRKHVKMAVFIYEIKNGKNVEP